ncbi:AAA family ATPase [Gimesia fumaroli]|uniref:ATP-dependent zinc metalloprotease FtsH n=1 Tax=Gimesia fumaroli TaxID=2527976 RepID=A0A518IAM0_9PLAN|nr:ATP-binding protein [Gimesia fumaroli]QDV50092.1 ATP-dependent zinc metalloprotease FtsH [Gimesia fumaroli]
MTSARNKQIADVESVTRLFRAHRDKNDAVFRKLAESIISDQLAANQYSLAKELRSALGADSSQSTNVPNRKLSTLPRDRRSGEQLLAIFHEPASTEHLLLEDETRMRIDRFIDERRNSAKLARYGYSPKSKLLFWGPPGCGKTLTAHHIANQFNLKVGVVRLSALISSYLGDTSARLQQVFDIALETPMVILFDEFDSVAKSRSDMGDVGELKRVVNSLLQAMDTFVSRESILIGASNHQYLLDPAIWRRFDDVVLFPSPSPGVRKKFIQQHLSGVRFSGSLDSLVKKMAGLSFAQIESILIEAIKSMILEDKKQLTTQQISSELKYMRSMMAAMDREIDADG